VIKKWKKNERQILPKKKSERQIEKI
jgi:hypothetical protein